MPWGSAAPRSNATDDVKAEIVPRIIDGFVKLALAMSEPGTGSNVAGIKTRAVRDGDS